MIVYSFGIYVIARLFPIVDGVDWLRTAAMGFLLLPSLVLSIYYRDRALACCVGAATLAYLVSAVTNFFDPGYIAHSIATWCGVYVMCTWHRYWHLWALSIPLILYNLKMYEMYGPRVPEGADPNHIGNWLYLSWCIASVAVVNKKTVNEHDARAKIDDHQFKRAA